MTGIFVAYNQAYYDEIILLLEKHGTRGYTSWTEISGRGSDKGEPHLGTHTWPTFNDALITFVEDDKVDDIMDSLHKLDCISEELGLRAFAWKIDKTV